MSYDENIKEIFGKLSNYREFAQSQAGIKLFRNGFAVKPFGIDGDDWLRLEILKQKVVHIIHLDQQMLLVIFQLMKVLMIN